MVRKPLNGPSHGPVFSGPSPDRRSEFQMIDYVRRRAAGASRGLVLGIGDDCAVLKQRSGSETVITADLLVEDIDFRLEYTSPELLGHKALAVSLSDIASMGANPRWAMLSVGIPGGLWRSKFLDRFYDGFFALAERHRVKLIGGDISRTLDGVVIDSIVIGEILGGRSLQRSGAKPGDIVFVTGNLGGAAAGLRMLQEGHRMSKASARSKVARSRKNLLTRQLAPESHNELGILLAKRQVATAMIDISDGLSSDLAHICEASGVGAVIDESRIPIDEGISVVTSDAVEQMELALNGGEDFELLFTVRPRKAQTLGTTLGAVRITEIGRITDSKGQVDLVQKDGVVKPLRASGYEHFRERV